MQEPIVLYVKALKKQEGTNIWWDAQFLQSFFEFESAACCKKKNGKNRASQQTFGPSYFVMALVHILNFFTLVDKLLKGM